MSNREEKLDANLTDVPASEEEFSLEEILAEYGGSLEQVLLRETEDALPPEPAPESPPRPEPEAQREPEKRKRPAGRKPAPPEEPPAEERQAPPAPPEIPPAPRPISLEEVVGSTVDAVMEEEHTEPLLTRRRGLFSRRPLEETEELPGPPEPEPEP